MSGETDEESLTRNQKYEEYAKLTTMQLTNHTRVELVFFRN
jgi:hypothetical protein